MKIKLNSNRQQGFFFVFGPLWFVALVMGAKALADHSQRKQLNDASDIETNHQIQQWKVENEQKQKEKDASVCRQQNRGQVNHRYIWDNNGTYSKSNKPTLDELAMRQSRLSLRG